MAKTKSAAANQAKQTGDAEADQQDGAAEVQGTLGDMVPDQDDLLEELTSKWLAAKGKVERANENLKAAKAAPALSSSDELNGDGHPCEWVEQLRLSFDGRPQQRGSKHAMVQKRWRSDRSIVWRTPPAVTKGPNDELRITGDPMVLMTDDNRDSSAYMAKLTRALRAAWDAREPLMGPIRLTARFYFARPKDHWGTGKNRGRLKPSAPAEYQRTPDLSKLIRCVEDCLTQSGVIKDDAQVCRYGEETGRYYSDATGHEYLMLQVDSRPDEKGGGAW